MDGMSHQHLHQRRWRRESGFNIISGCDVLVVLLGSEFTTTTLILSLSSERDFPEKKIPDNYFPCQVFFRAGCLFNKWWNSRESSVRVSPWWIRIAALPTSPDPSPALPWPGTVWGEMSFRSSASNKNWGAFTRECGWNPKLSFHLGVIFFMLFGEGRGEI